jgi:hypothetical protein
LSVPDWQTKNGIVKDAVFQLSKTVQACACCDEWIPLFDQTRHLSLSEIPVNLWTHCILPFKQANSVGPLPDMLRKEYNISYLFVAVADFKLYEARLGDVFLSPRGVLRAKSTTANLVICSSCFMELGSSPTTGRDSLL